MTPVQITDIHTRYVYKTEEGYIHADVYYKGSPNYTVIFGSDIISIKEKSGKLKKSFVFSSFVKKKKQLWNTILKWFRVNTNSLGIEYKTRKVRGITFLNYESASDAHPASSNENIENLLMKVNFDCMDASLREVFEGSSNSLTSNFIINSIPYIALNIEPVELYRAKSSMIESFQNK